MKFVQMIMIKYRLLYLSSASTRTGVYVSDVLAQVRVKLDKSCHLLEEPGTRTLVFNIRVPVGGQR